MRMWGASSSECVYNSSFANVEETKISIINTTKGSYTIASKVQIAVHMYFLHTGIARYLFEWATKYTTRNKQL